MDKLIHVIKVFINTLMTLVLIVGIVFITLYFIGIQPFVVETGSMQPTIQAGSISFVNIHVKYDEIKENDIIAFESSNGARVTHRVINITEEGFETKGDSNNKSDGISTTKSNYIGKNVFSIPGVGKFVKFIQTTVGKIVLVTIIVILLLVGFLTDDDKKRKKKKKKELMSRVDEDNKDIRKDTIEDEVVIEGSNKTTKENKEKEEKNNNNETKETNEKAKEVKEIKKEDNKEQKNKQKKKKKKKK